MNPEIPCPECDGAGFYGGNGPVVHSICTFCKGTGVHEPAEELVARPPGRAYRSVFSDDRNRDVVRKIASVMRERESREGMG